MYQVKVYTRQNAILVMESPILESRKEADEYYLSTGFGEGYWSEIHKIYPGYSETMLSNV
jgi:hypothetical protein